MKNCTTHLLIVFALVLLFSCGITHKERRAHTTTKIEIKDTSATQDSTQYELIVFDIGFDYWLASKSIYKKMYSNDYLQTHNSLYVQEWNRRYSAGDKLINSFIDYSITTKYDFEFNYKLYMYFLYFEESNGITLLPGPKRRY